jgi:hypothetical protein
MSDNKRQSRERLARFEQFEKRLMMTADPVASTLPPMDLSLPREPMAVEVATEFVAPVAPTEFPQAELSLQSEFASSSSEPTMAPAELAPSIEEVNSVISLARMANNPVSEAADIGSQFGFDGSGQTIAVIDSGIAWDHAALGDGFGAGNKVVGGWDFAENDANPYDDGPAGFHGTHVAGIIGSEDSQYQGVSSGADLVALRVFDDQGGGNLEWVESALQWVHDNRHAFENPITTVNLSLGTTWNAENTPDWATLEDEFAQLKADGIFISVAAGNSFEDYNATGLSYPAASSHVVPVASHGTDGDLSDFSQRSDRVLAAPGESIRSTVPSFLFGGTRNDAFLGASGTSMAAPYVAGASALLREAYESIGVTNINQDLLYQTFRDTANQIFDSVTGQSYSQLNLEAALAAVVSQKPESETPTEPPAAEAPVTPDPNPPASTPEPEIPAQPAEPPVTQPPVAFEGWHIKDRILIINGTNSDDAVHLDTTDSRFAMVSVNGSSRQFDTLHFDRIQVTGGSGKDQLSVNLGQSDDSVVITDGSLYVSNHLFSFGSRGFESVNVSSGGGNDMLTLLDTAGDDAVEVNAENMTASIATGQFVGTGQGFEEVYTFSTGGNDSLSFIGSHDADTFVSNDSRNMLRNANLRAVGDDFAEIRFIGNGGNDHANLYGTAGRDTFQLSPREATVTTDSSTLNIEDIGRMNVFSYDGLDRLEMYDSTGDDLYVSSGDTRTMQGDGYLNFAWNIADTHAFASGGYDVAQIQDTSGDDHLSANEGDVTFTTQDGVTQTRNFDRVNVISSNGGYDTAMISGTDGTDTLYATEDSVTAGLSNGQINRAVGFDYVQFDGGAGIDHTTLAGGSGNEKLTVSKEAVELKSTMQMLRMVNSEHTSFEGNGGVDEVVFAEFESLDLLESLGDRATAYLRDRTVSVSDFDILEAETVDDALAKYDLDTADFLYMLRGNWTEAE